jgi:tRNA (Thr-GGU) A37 N-methylase
MSSAQNREWTVHTVGLASCPWTDAIDDDWETIESTITLHEPYGSASLLGLDTFSHIEVIYLFDQVRPDSVQEGSRPRGVTSQPPWSHELMVD